MNEKQHALTLRIDESLWQKIREEAFNQHTSISALIREALAEKVDKWNSSN